MQMTNVNKLSLQDLRLTMRNQLHSNADRFSNLTGKVPLQLADTIADFSFLGKITNNADAVGLMKQLCLLSGTTRDEQISEFQPQLVEIKNSPYNPARQAIFLKPIKTSFPPESDFIAQSPLIIYEYSNEITVLIPSLPDPEIHLSMTIKKDLTIGSDAEIRLVNFINKANQMEHNVGTGIRPVYGKIGFENEVIEAVMKKMKTP